LESSKKILKNIVYKVNKYFMFIYFLYYKIIIN